MIFFQRKTRGQTWEKISDLRVFDSVVRGMGIGSVDAVVDGLADEVDAEGDEGGAEAREGLAQLVAHHRMLPPLVPPPEELPRRPQRLRHRSTSLLLPLFLSLRSLGSTSPKRFPLSPTSTGIERWRRCIVRWNDQFIQGININDNLRNNTNLYGSLDGID